MKDFPYYKKLGFENVFSWGEKDLSNFLIWDQIKAFRSRGNLEPHLWENSKSEFGKYNKYKFFLSIYDKLFEKLCFRDSKKTKRILFYNIKYPRLILKSKNKFSTGLIVTGKKDRLFSLKNFIGCLGVNDLYQYVFYYLKERKVKYLYQLIGEMEKKLKILKPDYVVLWVDNFPIERAVVVACKRLGITTLEIQHGLYQPTLPLTSGKMVDYLLVWGQHFKDVYVKQEIKKPEKIYILGYPYNISKPILEKKGKKKYKVYYLGQSYEKYTKEILPIKLKMLAELNVLSQKLNFDFFYRPHPLNNIKLLKSKLPKINFTPKHEKLFETINKGDIFIAFSSTTLIEAALRKKITLQLINYPLLVDNFEKLGVCTKSFQSIEQLDEYLKKIVKKEPVLEFKFNNNYVETRYNLEKRFFEILNKIEKKKL